MGIENQALIFSTNNLSGFDQMAFDLNSLDQTIFKAEIILTLRFYYWTGDWISIGYHQKEIPPHWEKLLSNGEINIVRRPSGGGAVLHSGGITYALTFKKSYYKFLSYEMVNNWLMKSFRELGLNLQNGSLRKSRIKTNCFGTSLISDLVDQDGFKRIGSAQYRKKNGFLQHGEIQTNPSKDLWFKLFKEEAPPKVNLDLTNDEIVQHLTNSFLANNSNLNFKKLP
ncbi:MAG: protein ligase [Prochlorococcus marinus CUG1432]|uniref:lipoyl protein ligase domain-containing protein n=1 Tax=Prochlorococcus marinus TaxID=1219 RepID=UPI001FD6BD00|nr:protein ligase [Prochlorococcus marinus]MCR8545922.1 protein ligase [Prochlorococcus marinus CUG1432]